MSLGIGANLARQHGACEGGSEILSTTRRRTLPITGSNLPASPYPGCKMSVHPQRCVDLTRATPGRLIACALILIHNLDIRNVYRVLDLNTEGVGRWDCSKALFVHKVLFGADALTIHQQPSVSKITTARQGWPEKGG